MMRARLLTLLSLLLAAWCGPAFAGQLVITNQSASAITCTVDGYTTDTGWPSNWLINVQAHQSFYVGQNFNRQTPVINWVQCGALRTRAMGITPDSPDGFVVLNGQQTRVLNVSLYAYIPQIPGQDFSNLVSYVISTFQAQNPQVLLSAQMNPNLNIYSGPVLQTLLSPSGLDVIELDTLFMSFLVQNGLVTPQAAPVNASFPVGVAGATVGGQLYGIPSWLCTNFLYGRTAAVSQATTLANLITYLNGQPSSAAKIATNFNGKWNLDAGYLTAYAQAHGYASISNAWTQPPDVPSVNNIIQMAQTCVYGGQNKCVDYTYANSASAAPLEDAFTSGQASTAVDYSERSFYILLNGYSINNLYATPLPWGPSPQPVLYSDAFVTSQATCASDPCATDSRTFTALMTSVAMKNYITASQDDPDGTPWRRLLVATTAFWQQPQIQQDRLYQAFGAALNNPAPYPNALTPPQIDQLFASVCPVVKQGMPTFLCAAPGHPVLTTRKAKPAEAPRHR